MGSYTIELNGTGEVSEGQFRNDTESQAWVESVLEARGYDADDLLTSDWGADGLNDDGEQCYRMLFWSGEQTAQHDSGVDAICQLCKVGS